MVADLCYFVIFVAKAKRRKIASFDLFDFATKYEKTQICAFRLRRENNEETQICAFRLRHEITERRKFVSFRYFVAKAKRRNFASFRLSVVSGRKLKRRKFASFRYFVAKSKRRKSATIINGYETCLLRLFSHNKSAKSFVTAWAATEGTVCIMYTRLQGC